MTLTRTRSRGEGAGAKMSEMYARQRMGQQAISSPNEGELHQSLMVSVDGLGGEAQEGVGHGNQR